MDELAFRRAVLADPHTQDPTVIAAAKADPNKQRFWQELKQQETQLNQLLHSASVPDNLADKLLWQAQAQTSTREFAPAKRASIWRYAVAASIVLGLSGTLMFQASDHATLLDAAYAHTTHKNVFEILASSSPDLAELNAKMARFGASLSSDIGKVLSANFCELKDTESLHLIVGDDEQPTSIFFLPKDMPLGELTKGQDVSTNVLQFEDTQVLILGAVTEQVLSVSEQLREQLQF
jgi:hypothetical protein